MSQTLAVSPSSREKILEVAEAHFARRGFSGVGLREVAVAAGLGKSSLFHHFESKAQLYFEVLERVLGRIQERLQPALAQAGEPASPARGLGRRAGRRAGRAPGHRAGCCCAGWSRKTTFPRRAAARGAARRAAARRDPPGHPRPAARGHRAGRLPQGVGAAHRADADRRHRLPLRVGRDRREHHGPPAALGRGRSPAQAGASQSVAARARGAPRRLKPRGGDHGQAAPGPPQALRGVRGDRVRRHRRDRAAARPDRRRRAHAAALDLGVRQRGGRAALALREGQGEPVERRARPRLVAPLLQGRMADESAGLDARQRAPADGARRGHPEGRHVRRDQLRALAAPARRAGGAPALRPARGRI